MKLKQKGFTLVELLISVAIIGLLIAIVVAGLDLIRQKGRDAARIADIKQLNGAIENYFDTCYTFPSTIYSDGSGNGLVPDCNGNIYISEVPRDPQGQNYLYYVSDGPDEPQGFHLCAQLELSYGDNKGKARAAPLAESDPCNGEDEFVFDVLGGALGN